MQKGLKIALALILVGLLVMLAGILMGGLQSVFVAGARFVNQLGDTQIIYDDTEIGSDEETIDPYANETVHSTVPPGDDPSWAMEMPEAPVEWPETEDEN